MNMSHFCVLVIGEDVDGQLLKYDENMEMPRYVKYTKEQLINRGKKEIMDFKKRAYDVYLKDPEGYAKKCVNPEHMNYIKDVFPKKLKWTESEIYADEIKFYEPGDIGENGEVYSTGNPNGKWDWYEIGGRWSGMLKLKKSINGCINTDQAYKREIDFTPSPDEIKKAKRFWELYVEGDKPKNSDEEKIVKNEFYNKEYYLKEYSSKDDYVTRSTEFSTFAVIKNGTWYEKGEMGWFGMSSATHKESGKWDRSFFDKWIKNLPDDAFLTVVDCHS